MAAGDPQLQPLAPNSPGNAFEGGHKRVKVQYTGVEAVWGVRGAGCSAEPRMAMPMALICGWNQLLFASQLPKRLRVVGKEVLGGRVAVAIRLVDRWGRTEALPPTLKRTPAPQPTPTRNSGPSLVAPLLCVRLMHPQGCP